MLVHPSDLNRFLHITKWVFVAVVAVLPGPNVLQADNMRGYSFRTWETTEGLPHNSIYSVLQRRDGHLWFGTYRGVGRFDGARFTSLVVTNLPQLRHEQVRALHETRDHALWIGTEEAGLYRMKEGVVTQFPLSPRRRLRCFLESEDGSLWIGTADGLGRYKDGELTWLTVKEGLPDPIVICLCEDQDGNLWVGTNHGLIRYRDGFHELYRQANGLPTESVRALLCDTDNSLWVGSGGAGLARLKDGRFEYFNKEQGIPDSFISSLFKDSHGQFWVGTLSGLCRMVDGRFVIEKKGDTTPYETIFCMIEDREGNIWAGTKEGLSQLRAKTFFTYTKAEGVSHNNVISIYEDRQQQMWIGTWGGGLTLFKDMVPTVHERTNGLNDLVLSMHESRDGAMWVGSDYDGGLYRWKDGVWTRYGRAEGMKENALRVIHEDRAGRLWIGTSSGLIIWRDGTAQHFSSTNGLAGNAVRAICEQSDGSLWFGTSGGLSRYQDGKFANFTTTNGLAADLVLALYSDAQNNLWIGTDGGLNCLRDGKLTAYTRKDGLFNDSILEILEDDFGNLWMSCYSGVFRISKKNLENFDRGLTRIISCVAYGRGDGMGSVQCNGVGKPSGWKTKDGRLWFPTTRGIVVADPQVAIEMKREQPPVFIEEVTAKKELRFSSMTDRRPASIVLEPGHDEIEFRFAALSFREPERNRFKYKLEGVDSDWVDAGERAVAFYNNLRPGRYRFQVIACNSESIWNEKGDVMSVELLPYFWQTWWFGLATVLAAVGLVGGTARYATRRRMHRRLQALEQQAAIERERTRIARDIHDELGARLTQISFLGSVAKRQMEQPAEAVAQIDKISDTALEMVAALDEIVWAVDPRNDTLDGLATYLCRYASEFFSSTTTFCQFDFPAELPPIRLDTDVRHNLFLAVKEAMNNILKHADATEVSLKIVLHPGEFALTVSDNGKGLPVDASPAPDKSKRVGNGLRNMRQRLESIGGRCAIQSEPGETVIAFFVPFERKD